uniref:EF-hand domain-containing protein n=1 Tax=Macrostomum lignano TaxID=282301 RepID=A0A1I8IZC2_9PLAT
MTTSSRWHAEHERLVVYVEQHRADFIEDDEVDDEDEFDEQEEPVQKMEIVREWLTAIPETPAGSNSSTRNASGKGKGDRRRLQTASYARTRDSEKTDTGLVRLSSSKRRASASSQVQHNRRKPLRSLASLVRRGGRLRQALVEQTDEQQQQQQQHVYNQAAKPINSSAPLWLAAVQSTKKSNNNSNNKSKQRQSNRPRSRSVEVTSSTPASGGSSPRHRVTQWGSSSNLLATQSSSGNSASLETLRAKSRSPLYQRVTSAKPIQSRQQQDAAVRKPDLTAAATPDRDKTTIKRRLVAQVPQSAVLPKRDSVNEPEQQEQAAAEPAQDSVWQQIDFSMLRQIGQRRPKTAFEAAANTDLTADEASIPANTPSSPTAKQTTVKSTKPQARRAAAATARSFEASAAATQPLTANGCYNSSEKRQLLQSGPAEPETAVGYFVERERAKTARQSRAAGKNGTVGRESLSQSLLSSEQQEPVVGVENSLTNSTARAQHVFQLQPAPGQNSAHKGRGVAGNLATASTADKKPVSYGYNWLQEFNKMSMTEAEIERRVKNGGKLRNSASQTTRFELPFDLKDLEEMDPKDYLRQYTVVSSRRLYLYQKVFQKYRNPSLNAVEVKDLSKCISDIIVGGISEEKLEEMLHLTSMLDAGQLDSKLFYAFCAVVERQTTGKKMPDDPSELMECHKQRLESADFIGLSYKFKGISLSEEMARLLKAFRGQAKLMVGGGGGRVNSVVERAVRGVHGRAGGRGHQLPPNSATTLLNQPEPHLVDGVSLRHGHGSGASGAGHQLKWREPIRLILTCSFSNRMKPAPVAPVCCRVPGSVARITRQLMMRPLTTLASSSVNTRVIQSSLHSVLDLGGWPATEDLGGWPATEDLEAGPATEDLESGRLAQQLRIWEAGGSATEDLEAGPALRI